MIYLDNTSEYAQSIFIPRNETFEGTTAHTQDYDEGYRDGYAKGRYVGYNEGYASGHTAGYNEGRTAGYNEGYASGRTDGYTSGHTEGYNEGYASGHTVGYNEGYASGRTDGYASGHTAGYNEGYGIGYSEGYTQGKADGIAQQKALLSSIEINDNGLYTSENGYSAVTVNVPQTGTTPVLISKTIISNGTYTPEQGVDGFSAVTVNINVQDYYDQGYSDGYNKAYEEIYNNQDFLAFEILESGSLRLINANVYYSINSKDDWQLYTGNTIDVNAGDIVYFRDLTKISESPYPSFNGSTIKFNLSGNIMSLIDGSNFNNLKSMENHSFRLLFYSTGVVSAKNLRLPATTLSESCYLNMFDGCTSLTTAPKLPATTLEASCYYGMFQDCTSLTTAPELPATTLALSCYYLMFDNCTSLTTAPELPATTLALSCYYLMFQDCTSLTTVPELPATTLANNCYNYMFQGCTSLNYIKCLASSIPNYGFTDWVKGVSSTGTFTKVSTTSWPIGDNGIPSGWTVINE